MHLIYICDIVTFSSLFFFYIRYVNVVHISRTVCYVMNQQRENLSIIGKDINWGLSIAQIHDFQFHEYRLLMDKGQLSDQSFLLFPLLASLQFLLFVCCRHSHFLSTVPCTIIPKEYHLLYLPLYLYFNFISFSRLS